MIIEKQMPRSIKTIRKWIKRICIMYAVAFSCAGTALLIALFLFVMKPIWNVKYIVAHNPVQTAYMKTYHHTLSASGDTSSLRQTFVPLSSISKDLVNAVLAAEDDGFYTHPGFDLIGMINAYEYNLSHHAFKRGASTITQQLAKNLFLNGKKAYSRKAMELVYTLLMEHYLGKDRILELYLNYVQFGKTVFGCEAASQIYFQKSCDRMTQWEAVRLAAVLMNPVKYTPQSQSGFVERRIAVIQNNLYLRSHPRDTIEPDELDAPSSESINTHDTAATMPSNTPVVADSATAP